MAASNEPGRTGQSSAPAACSASLSGWVAASVGGASLGTEIGKCLALAGNYEAFGCDISPTAYGLYDGSFKETFRIDRENYISDVINACHASGAIWLIAGGEQPTALLSAAEAELADHGIALVANSPEIVRLFSDKAETFRKLGAAGFPIPRTRLADGTEAIFAVGLPCIIKPATGSGGSGAAPGRALAHGVVHVRQPS